MVTGKNSWDPCKSNMSCHLLLSCPAQAMRFLSRFTTLRNETTRLSPEKGQGGPFLLTQKWSISNIHDQLARSCLAKVPALREQDKEILATKNMYVKNAAGLYTRVMQQCQYAPTTAQFCSRAYLSPNLHFHTVLARH